MPEIQKWSAGEPYVHPHGRLLEGPFFEEYANRLRFVDIKGKKLFTLDLATGPSSLQEHTLDTPISITADIEGVDPKDRILIGAKYGLAVLDRRTWAYQYVKRYYEGERAERMRSNDLNVDGEGRVWVGTMNDFPVGDPQEEAELLHIDGSLNQTKITSGLNIPNGIGWSAAGTTMYFVRSLPDRALYAYDYDSSSGSVTNPRKFWQNPSNAEPDGFALDTEGHLWQALYGDGKVVRLSPEGEVVGEVKLLTKAITSVCFVGEDIFITTAAEAEPEKYPESAKYGGALFKVHVGKTGVKRNKARFSEEVMKKFGLK